MKSVNLTASFIHIAFTIIFSGAVAYLSEPSGAGIDTAHIKKAQASQNQGQEKALKYDIERDLNKKLLALKAE
jgi:hypothetical protein